MMAAAVELFSGWGSGRRGTKWLSCERQKVHPETDSQKKHTTQVGILHRAGKRHGQTCTYMRNTDTQTQLNTHSCQAWTKTKNKRSTQRRNAIVGLPVYRFCAVDRTGQAPILRRQVAVVLRDHGKRVRAKGGLEGGVGGLSALCIYAFFKSESYPSVFRSDSVSDSRSMVRSR